MKYQFMSHYINSLMPTFTFGAFIIFLLYYLCISLFVFWNLWLSIFLSMFFFLLCSTDLKTSCDNLADCPFKTHRWGTSWPDCGEDSLQRIERLELLRDRRTRRSTKHGTCGTQRTRQRDARPLSGTSCRAAAVWRSYTCRGRAGRLMSGSST